MRALQRCEFRRVVNIIMTVIVMMIVIVLVRLATEEPDLIGDFTRPFALPLINGKHQDLKCITPQTLVDLMDGKFQSYVENFTIVDCR